MAEAKEYRPVFSAESAEFILRLSRRNRRRVMDIAYQLATDPFLRSDYTVVDADGRPIEHLRCEGFVFMYWVDHAVQLVMITEIEKDD
jgi:hypothetical protein